MRCQCVKKFEYLTQIRIYMRKGFSPLIRGPGRMFNEKTEGRQSRDTVHIQIVRKIVGKANFNKLYWNN
jgi:hypothetical protein